MEDHAVLPRFVPQGWQAAACAHADQAVADDQKNQRKVQALRADTRKQDLVHHHGAGHESGDDKLTRQNSAVRFRN